MTPERAERLLERRGALSRFFLWPFAVRSLVKTSDIRSTEILAHTLDHDWTDAYWQERITNHLIHMVRNNAVAAQALWRAWAADRVSAWGVILREARVACEDPDLRDLSMLKLGLDNEMPIDHDFALDMVRFASDDDPDVRHAFRSYTGWLRATNHKLFQQVCLRSRDYVRVGCSRDLIDELLLYEGEDWADLRDAYRKQLPTGLSIFWDLRTGETARIRLQPPTPWEILPYLDDADETITRRAEAVVAELSSTQPELWTLILLKLGKIADLKQHPAAVREVLRWLDHPDADVGKAVAGYIEALPRDEATSQVLFTEWVRRDSDPDFAGILVEDRLPPGPGMRTLYFLITSNFDAYIELEDDDGELFLEAWLIASEAQRKRLNEIIGNSGNDEIIQAYQRALSRRDDYDLQLHIDALTAAGLDERLFDLVPEMCFRQALAALLRWRENAWRPQDVGDRKLVDEAIAKYDELCGIGWQPSAAALPVGTMDLFEYLQTAKPDGPPFDSLRDVLSGEKSGELRHWIERYCAGSCAGEMDFARQEDQVLWMNLATGNLPVLMEAELSCEPEEFERIRSLYAAVDGVEGTIPKRLAALTAILLLFQRRLNTDIELIDDDHPTDAAAVEIEIVEEDGS